MATLEPDDPQNRRKKTVWLMAGGAASLLIPLAGAVYLHWSQNAGASGPSGRSDVFERREGEERKIIPTQTAVVLSPPGLMAPSRGAGAAVAADKTEASSLDFIKSNADMQARIADPKAAAPAAPAVSTTPAAPAAVAAAPGKKGSKQGKKAFTMPKLQPSRGFTNFGTTGAKGPGAAGVQAGTGGGQNPQDILKNLPPGSENDPRVQAYLKSQQPQ